MVASPAFPVAVLLANSIPDEDVLNTVSGVSDTHTPFQVIALHARAAVVGEVATRTFAGAAVENFDGWDGCRYDEVELGSIDE